MYACSTPLLLIATKTRYAVFPLVYGVAHHTDDMVGVFIGELTGVAV
jgi:hypothetical protein